MREINVKEYTTSEAHRLSSTERDALQSHDLSLAIGPVKGEESVYHLTPGSTVGAVQVGGLSVLIEPKIGIPQLLSLACYAIGAYKLQLEEFAFREERRLPDALALALASAAQRAFSRGLLHGYRTQEEALHTVRGRIRFDEQIRRRFGVAPPVEVRHDEFTDDILENRVVKAAVLRLGAMALRSPKARRELGRTAAVLENVSPVEYSPRTVPKVPFNRLNQHYRDVVELSRLVLRHGAFESGRGEVRASGFLMDMNVVFQEFVTVALREALGVSERVFRESTIPSLDTEGDVGLKPDLTWWHNGRCFFVGDAKYKRITGGSVPNADLYQLLAYTTALNLPGGLLVYAQDEEEPLTSAVYQVRKSGKLLEVAALDLSADIQQILARVGSLADSVRVLCAVARGYPLAA